MQSRKTGNSIRQEFIDFFIEKGHKFVPSSSLVPGGDQTLLFTNAGMVQFKDVFLGIDKRDYTRAVNSQKCMRVAGKHNDLDDVGRDTYHHTFFEMLGNWSFGDYYKNEAISWAWELFTDRWKLNKEKIWVTCFKDEKEEIDTDHEAADAWKLQIGIDASHILFFGRKDNFWEMADVGPCGPCSEIHFDRGEEFCDKQHEPGHRCTVNGDCHRFLELWNLVFIQYNRTSPDNLDPLPSKHVDTGMGFDRIVSILQGVDSNYETDLLMPLMDEVMALCGGTIDDREHNLTPYRVIADHTRAASFLIGDGVIPGNIGRNYVCRMIIRRAARFGSKLGLNKPFLASVANHVIEIYKQAYPDLEKNKSLIFDNLTREEERFQSTVESGLAYLDNEIKRLQSSNNKILSGNTAFELYATHGLPLEITRDVLNEQGMGVDESSFYESMQAHRINSGAGKELGPMGGEDAEYFSTLGEQLKKEKKLDPDGVAHNPYEFPVMDSEVAAIINQNRVENCINQYDKGMLIIKGTGFYLESGGQVSDTGLILSKNRKNIFRVDEVRKPAPGIIIHIGEMLEGQFNVGDEIIAQVDLKRRNAIKRNHTATHLLHAQLRKVLGNHVRQAGSLVAPDRLRFDFTHSRALTNEQIESIEKGINENILDNYALHIEQKPLQKALDEGAIALFGEKYSDEVRTISIGQEEKLSLELCGGTHVHETAEIGYFLIQYEGSVAAGIRRIEAVTGQKAFENLASKSKLIKEISKVMDCQPDEILTSIEKLLLRNEFLSNNLHEINKTRAFDLYEKSKNNMITIGRNKVMTVIFENSEIDTLRMLADRFREDFESGIAVFANIKESNQIEIIGTVTDDLVKNGYHAGQIVKKIAEHAGGGGGGKPQLAQAGCNDKVKFINAMENIEKFLN